MSVKIRGYRWTMNYRGFDVYYSERKGSTFAVLGSKITESYKLGSQPEFVTNDADEIVLILNGFWDDMRSTLPSDLAARI